MDCAACGCEPTVTRFRCHQARRSRPGCKPITSSCGMTAHGVARHERCYSRQQQILDLEHYLDVLRKKPGALAGSTPLAQWRQAGRWPECFDRLWQALNARQGRQDGTRQMIELLSLGTSEGWDRLRAAVEQSLSLGCQDVAAIRHLLVAGRLTKNAVAPIDIGVLARYE